MTADFTVLDDIFFSIFSMLILFLFLFRLFLLLLFLDLYSCFFFCSVFSFSFLYFLPFLLFNLPLHPEFFYPRSFSRPPFPIFIIHSSFLLNITIVSFHPWLSFPIFHFETKKPSMNEPGKLLLNPNPVCGVRFVCTLLLGASLARAAPAVVRLCQGLQAHINTHTHTVTFAHTHARIHKHTHADTHADTRTYI